ncbi:nicotinate phosphoribosyltransferase [Aquicella lusitana]|uniref:Nicotinate phosphoribosyltransferase n=1 Tax=Aquicella lusitana TaxID=254246 RepID=A0A370GS42_9COXI|nr:nicotinate phosphoribosyltransferase [Aquicella lusitana]RDI46507.1 nicotinate phosphoribosyltransferase [Aquicella lusitana]VVC74171.1 Nicotinate phosphoribosyltransferase pncB2 [Aquicella lusitana]
MIPYTYTPLLTDLYQFTMAYGYWKLNMHEQEAVFHLIFRKNPFKSNRALCCGLASVVEFLKNWRFQQDDLDFLATLKNIRNEPLLPDEFLHYLSRLTFTCDVDAIPEGTVVFPHEPLLRIQGPLLQCQLLESPLLNIINFQTLIATKASRVCRAAQGEPVIEFGMRRAQGPDGALSASRASYIGGCVATSNTLAGKLYDIPVRGTHAHSWVTAFANEKEAFASYASIMPHNCVLLVDTYNTVEGVKNAIEIGKKLREQEADLLAIRLDSGDMADLSIKARTLLDEAGFEKTGILASNSLDEYVIHELKEQGAKISSWGVGTNLATAYDHPALDGVYKLSALRDPEGQWQYKLKLSEQSVKISNPGRHQVRRFFCNEKYVMDVIYDLELGISDTPEAVLLDPGQQLKKLDDIDAFVDLLEPVFRKGQYIHEATSIHTIRENAIEETSNFYRMHGESQYDVGLEKNLYTLKLELIEKVKP